MKIAEFHELVAGLGIAGLRRIYTGAAAPVEMYARDLPALLPDPRVVVESSANTPLTMGGRGWIRRRIFNYVCLVAEVGQDRKPGAHAEKMASIQDAVENAFCDLKSTNTSLHAVESVTVNAAGLVQDAAGKQYHGFTIQVAALFSY